MAAAAALLTLLAACGKSNSSTNPSSSDHNRADVTFAQGMIPHHRQAVMMAEMATGRAASEEVRNLARQIKEAQGPEIRRMQSWLSDWNEPTRMGHDMGDVGSMEQGMMSGNEMTDMRHARGATFDRMFLTGMIAHHKGAVSMARTELRAGEFPPAKDLARDIVRTQMAEIRRMNTLLNE